MVDKKDLIDVSARDPSPTDKEARALYVSQVAGIYKEILEPKLKQMITRAHDMLEEASNDREYDQAIKGTIYAFRELMRWGELMVSEQVDNQNNGADIKINP